MTIQNNSNKYSYIHKTKHNHISHNHRSSIIPGNIITIQSRLTSTHPNTLPSEIKQSVRQEFEIRRVREKLIPPHISIIPDHIILIQHLQPTLLLRAPSLPLRNHRARRQWRHGCERHVRTIRRGHARPRPIHMLQRPLQNRELRGRRAL